MSYEHCCECDAHTGRAGAGDGSLYAGDWGPYCEECWYDLPGNLVDKYTALENKNAQLQAELDAATTYGLFQANNCDVLQSQLKKIEAELAALREQEPVARLVEHDDFPVEVELCDELDYAPEIMEQEAAMGWRFTPLYTAPQPAIPEGYVLVPVEPTAGMIEAGRESLILGDFKKVKNNYERIYKAMLAAKENNHD
jgi:hypothetical protein